MTNARSPRADEGERQARRAARRAQLLDAATVAIRRDGPRVSMEAIAAEAGVTKPIVYKHFGDRDGLVEALAVGFVDDLLRELETALTQQVEPQQLLVNTIDAYLSFVERDPAVYRFLVQRAQVLPAAGQTVAGVMSRIGHQVAVVLGEQLRAAGMDSGAAEPWGFGIVGMVHLAGDWWVDRQTMPRARLVQYLTTLLWNGMANGAVPVSTDQAATTDEGAPPLRAVPSPTPEEASR